MGMREQFLEEYNSAVLASVSLPPELAEKYSVLSCLKDGERQVYLLDSGTERAVLKLQPSGLEVSLKLEYELLLKLSHPQLPRPLAYAEWNGHEYLVREYVEGASLAELVDARGPLPPKSVRAAAMSLCRVLQYLHGQAAPVICRDVKPQNVIMDSAGVCHLIDLGAARMYSSDSREDTVLLGTQATAPPEQYGYQQTDQRSDIYSLGILMRYLLYGSYERPTADNGSALKRIIRRCTAFDPQNRYSSVSAVYRTLKHPYLRRGLCAVSAAAVLAAALLALFWPREDISPLLEEALRRELGLDAGAAIPSERLDDVEQLLICGETLPGTLQGHEAEVNYTHDLYAYEMEHGDIGDDDVELLAKCPNLRVLVLDYQEITDITPLKDLPLEYLSLTGNSITDITPLTGMDGLQVLDLAENPVRSADLLAELPELRELSLEATGVTSIEAFRGCDLQYINVRTTRVDDYTPLADCAQLTRLVTGFVPEGAVETLSGLTGLVELRLYSTQNVDLSCFTSMQQLQELDLTGSRLVNPEALAQLPSLRNLLLGDTDTSELKFLADMPSLTELDLRDNPLLDLSPLLDCPWLDRLKLSQRHKALADTQLAAADLAVEYG